MPASQPKRRPWTWSSGYESHAHADLPFRWSQKLAIIRPEARNCKQGPKTMQCQAPKIENAMGQPNNHSLQCTGHPAAQSHNPALWIEQSHAKGSLIDSTRSPEAALVVAHVATRQSLGHRFTGNAHWSLERWAQCCSIALVAQLHLGRGAIRGDVTSLNRTAKCRCHTSLDSLTHWHPDL